MEVLNFCAKLSSVSPSITRWYCGATTEPVPPALCVPELGAGLDFPKGSLPPLFAGLILLLDDSAAVVLPLMTGTLLAGTLVLDPLFVEEVVAGGMVEVVLTLPGVSVWGTVGIGVGFLSG